MKSARAPEGFQTHLTVVVYLEGQKLPKAYTWTTPLALHVALHKGPEWAKREMTVQKIDGRSKIVGLDVRAHYRSGRFSSV